MNVYRQAMVNWAKELEREGDLARALEVQARIMRADIRANRRAKRLRERS